MAGFNLTKAAFSAGELSPSLFGRIDLAKWHVGASVMRNMFVSYRGGANSRAGTAFVGQCKQPASASSTPPRLVKFQYSIFQSYILELGDQYMRVIANGAYVTEQPFTITAASQAYPCVLTVPNHNFAAGDWIFISGVGGMTRLNGRTFIVLAVTSTAVTIEDLFGAPVDSRGFAAYTSGGSAARIYTTSSPYAAADLPYLKFVQSADVMSFACVNLETGTEYPPYDLKRTSATSWQFTQLTFASAISAPASASAVTSQTTPVTSGQQNPSQYSYQVTAIDAQSGEESQASPTANITNSVDISLYLGTHTVSWSPVQNAAYYKVYMAPEAYQTAVPVGSVFGFVGTAFGTQFINSNITPDYTVSPPLHQNPFARGAILSATKTGSGSNYTQATVGVTINSATGQGAILVPVVSNGDVTALIVQNGGEGYTSADSVQITDSGTGSGATFTLNIGPQKGTYPGVVAYFQERRVYASTINNPDTYFFSQTGAYLNFDAASPPVDSDAITGTPWGQQVNGVQWLIPMPGGLIVATGDDAWQLSGAAGAGSPITPSSQSATPQESNGYSPTVKPLRIDKEIVYVSSLGSRVYDLQYNFYFQIYTGTDITVPSNHLFEGHQITSWAWAKQPNRIIWATREDGKFLSLSFLKEQEICAWARHDTNGIVCGVEVATEPPVDVPYFLVKRWIAGRQQWAYYVERMDNRVWASAEDTWCIDCGLALPQTAPNATLSAAAAEGPGTLTGGYIAFGGQGYSAPSAQISDPTGQGSGASIQLTVTAGVITGLTVLSQGQNYSPSTIVTIADPTGTGATINPIISQNVLFNASGPVFTAANVGNVIRVGGGNATVTAYNSPTQVAASINVPIRETIPNDPNKLPRPAGPGGWTITTPVSTVSNLDHLEGMEVSVLADGSVVAGGTMPLLVVQNGTINLPAPASSIKVGLPFTVQLQSMHAGSPNQPDIQGRKKKVTGFATRLEKSRGVQVGCNQPVASTLDFQQEIAWSNLEDVPDYAADNMPDAALPLFTGDKWVNVAGNWQNWNGFEPAPGFMAAQQTNPLPMNVLAFYGSIETAESEAQ